MKLLKYYFRRFRNDSIYSVTSVIGLTIGMTTTFLIALYIINELGYDHHHKNAGKIFRIINENTIHHFTEFNSPYLMGPAVKDEIPGISSYCRDFNLYGSQVQKSLIWMPAEGVYSIDNQVSEVFSFTVISGKIPARFELSDIFVSESFAHKFLTGPDFLGKTIRMKIKDKEFDFIVRAVYADYPSNSTFKPEALVSMEIAHQLITKYLSIVGDSSFLVNFTDTWKNDFYQDYLMLDKDANSRFISLQLDSLVTRHQGKDRESSYSLQKLTDAYLHSAEIIGGIEAKGSFTNVLIFLLVSILVLLASGMNYVLLFTSRSMARIKELGIRRVMGAGKTSILNLLISEAVYTSFLALPLAIMFTELLLPEENKILETKIAIHYFQNFWYMAAVFMVPLLLGILSGLFVSLYTYRRSNAEAMRNPLSKNQGMPVNKILIVFQLAIFTGLISAVLIIRNQVNMLLKTDPGFETENLLILPFPDETFGKQYESFKNSVASIPGVLKVSGAMFTPPSLNVMGMEFDYPSLPGGKMAMEFLIADYDFIETMGMRLTRGRSFSRNFPADKNAIILNESAVREMNIKDPVGTKLPIGIVLGVIKDLQLHSLQQAKKPAYISLNPNASREILIRLKPGYLQEVMAALRAKMKEATGSNEFMYNFYSDKLRELYKTEIKLKTIISIFSVVALFLACLGLFGLASLMAEQRTKEIGIRKVNGARTIELIIMLSWNISRWVLLSSLIAVLPVWYFLNKWLEQYVYHIQMSIWFYIEAASAALLVTVFTTIWHGYRCASINPVEALKYE